MVLAGCGGRKADPPTVVLEQLPNITTNLRGSGAYVNLSVTLMLHGGGKQWKSQLPAVEAAVLAVIRGETATALAGAKGQQTLAQAVQAAVKPLVPTLAHVYVTKLVVD